MTTLAANIAHISQDVVQALKGSGELDWLQAQLRAVVYKQLTGRQLHGVDVLHSTPKPSWLKQTDGALTILLIHDFLEAGGCSHTVRVLEPECGLQLSPGDKANAAQQLGLHLNSEPLLLQLVRRVQSAQVPATQPAQHQTARDSNPAQLNGNVQQSPTQLHPLASAATAAAAQPPPPPMSVGIPTLKPIKTRTTAAANSDTGSASLSVSDSSEGGAKLGAVPENRNAMAGSLALEAEATSRLTTAVAQDYEDDFGSISDEVEVVEADDSPALSASAQATSQSASWSGPSAAAFTAPTAAPTANPLIIRGAVADSNNAPAPSQPIATGAAVSSSSTAGCESRRALQDMGMDDVLDAVLGSRDVVSDDDDNSGSQASCSRSDAAPTRRDTVQGSQPHSMPFRSPDKSLAAAADAASDAGSNMGDTDGDDDDDDIGALLGGIADAPSASLKVPVPPQLSLSSTRDEDGDVGTGALLGGINDGPSASQNVPYPPQLSVSRNRDDDDDDEDDVTGILCSLSGPTPPRQAGTATSMGLPVTPASAWQPDTPYTPPDTLQLLGSTTTTHLQGSVALELASAGASSVRRNPLASDVDDEEEQHDVPTWTKMHEQDISPRPDIASWGLPVRVPVKPALESTSATTQPAKAADEEQRRDSLLLEGLGDWTGASGAAAKSALASSADEDDDAVPAWGLPSFAGDKTPSAAPLPTLAPVKMSTAASGLEEFDISNLLDLQGDGSANAVLKKGNSTSADDELDDDDDLPLPMETSAKAAANADLADVFGDDD